jgi:hypothetical protein
MIRTKQEAERVAQTLRTTRGQAAFEVIQGWKGWEHAVLQALDRSDIDSWSSKEETSMRDLLRWLPEYEMPGRSGELWDRMSSEQKAITDECHATRISIAVGLLGYHVAADVRARVIHHIQHDIRRAHSYCTSPDWTTGTCTHDLEMSEQDILDQARAAAAVAGEAYRQEVLSR